MYATAMPVALLLLGGVVAVAIIDAPDPEGNLAAFQANHPEWVNQTALFASNLTFEAGWANGGCELRGPEATEKALTQVGMWIPGASRVAAAVKAERGLERIAGAEGCLAEQIPELAVAIMRANASMQVNESFAQQAQEACGWFDVRRDGAKEIESAAVNALGGKLLTKTGKVVGSVIRSATGEEIPLIDAVTTFGVKAMTKALLPETGEELANIEQQVCYLAKALKPNGRDELRDDIVDSWRQLTHT